MKIDLASLQNAFTGLKNDFAMMRNGFAALFHGFAPMRDAIAKMYGRYAMMQAARAMMLSAFLPTLELGEVLAELLAVLVGGEVHTRVLVELVDELDAEVYHLLHGAVLRELTLFIAILAVLGVEAAIGIGAAVGIDRSSPPPPLRIGVRAANQHGTQPDGASRSPTFPPLILLRQALQSL